MDPEAAPLLGGGGGGSGGGAEGVLKPTGFGFATLVMLAVNTMNGPGLVALSRVFNGAGWVPSTIVLVCSAVITAYTVAAFTHVLERDLRRHPGDKSCIEYAGLSRRYLGRTGFVTTMVLLCVSLVMLACAQIVVTAQALDAFVVGLFGASPAVVYYPSPDVIVTHTRSLMPFPVGTWGVSAGFVLDAALCVYLGTFNLEENILPQYAALAIAGTAVVVLYLHLLSSAALANAPAVGNLHGDDATALLGVSVFNFAYVIAVPSLYADASKRVDFRCAMSWGVATMCGVCWLLGVLGAAARPAAPSANVLVSIYTDPAASVATRMAVKAYLLALALPIPIYTILLKRNLQALTEHATILSLAAPWLGALFCYMQPWFQLLINWSSLLCLGFVNYTIPLLVTLAYHKNEGHGATRTLPVFLCLVASLGAIVLGIYLNVVAAVAA